MKPLHGGPEAPVGTERSIDATVSGLEIRSLEGVAEYDKCAELQRRIWGDGYEDVVPSSMLQVCQKAGGVLAAAVLPEGDLAGFVFGIVSHRGTEVSHWSHMLGVLSEHRGRGIGQALKIFQRDLLVEQGIHVARWTYDPLVSGNANFNINLLGACVEAYHEEVYGDTGSALHAFGTDRFVARWDLRSEPVPEAIAAVHRDAPVVNVLPDAPMGGLAERDVLPEHVRIEIPRHILRIARERPQEALAWRLSTREAFQACLASGFRVVGFDPGREGERAWYFLSRAR